jgi:arginase
MPFAVSLGHGDPRLVNMGGFAPKVEADKAVLIGIRDLDPDEREMIAMSGITAFSMRDIDHMGLTKVSELALSAIGRDVSGLHVSFDIDVMDPDIAPGVSTPSPGGLSFRESSLALTFLAETELVRSIDIAELNPANDVKNRTAEVAVNLAMTCLGSRIL